MEFLLIVLVFVLIVVALRLPVLLADRDSVEYFLLPPGGEGKQGPFSVRQLSAALREFGEDSRIRIRSTETRAWVSLSEAGAVFPALVKAGICELPDDAEDIRRRHGRAEDNNSPETNAQKRATKARESEQAENFRRRLELHRRHGSGRTSKASDMEEVAVASFWSEKDKTVRNRAIAGDAPSEEASKNIGELEQLLRAAMKWSGQYDFPMYDKYPQYAAIRRIGQSLHDRHGVEGMQHAFYVLARTIPREADMLHQMWHGIGSWQA